MLTLPIKKKWFDMIKSGQKREEYREIKPYWTTRFNNELNKILNPIVPLDFTRNLQKDLQYLIVEFKNEYRKDSPKIKCECSLRIGQGKLELGAEPNKEYYILEILEIMEG